MASLNLDIIYDNLLDDRRQADLGLGSLMSNRDCRKTTPAERRYQRKLAASAAHVKKLRQTIEAYVESDNTVALRRRLEREMTIAAYEENLSGRDLMGIIGQQFSRSDYTSRDRMADVWQTGWSEVLLADVARVGAVVHVIYPVWIGGSNNAASACLMGLAGLHRRLGKTELPNNALRPAEIEHWLDDIGALLDFVGRGAAKARTALGAGPTDQQATRLTAAFRTKPARWRGSPQPDSQPQLA